MKNHLHILWGLSLLVASSASGAGGNPVAGQEKAAMCMACHGPDGNSLADTWPRLAGQLPDYLGRQIQDFKAGRRSDEQMSPQAANLAEGDIQDIVAFFSSQKLAPGEPDKSLTAEQLALGEQIYRKGKGRPVPATACIGCHGPTGAGNKDWNKTWSKTPAVLAPAIGGQHAAYIEKQLKAYRDGSRKNDPAKVMREITRGLNDSEIIALANYISRMSR